MSKHMKSRVYRYLIFACQFNRSTLDLLNDANLEKLAAEKGFKK